MHKITDISSSYDVDRPCGPDARTISFLPGVEPMLWTKEQGSCRRKYPMLLMTEAGLQRLCLEILV